MGNAHLVTGYYGEAHITAADQGSINAGIFGESEYVLSRGSVLKATTPASNTIRIHDGDLVMQGRHVRVAGTIDLTISSGTQSRYRNDLIVARYLRDENTGVEECSLVVIEGTASSSSASDPKYTTSNILDNTAYLHDMPLYRVSLNGVNITAITQLFKVVAPLDSVYTGDASTLTSGTVASDRLPVVPVSKGGTNANNATDALSNLGGLAKTGGEMTGALGMQKNMVFWNSGNTEWAGTAVGSVTQLLNESGTHTTILSAANGDGGRNYSLEVLNKSTERAMRLYAGDSYLEVGEEQVTFNGKTLSPAFTELWSGELTEYDSTASEDSSTAIENGYGDYTGYVLNCSVVASGVISPLFIPAVMLTDTVGGSIFNVSDETYYMTVFVWYEDGTLHFQIRSMNNSAGGIYAVYGLK